MRYLACLLTLGALALTTFASIKNDASTVDRLRQALIDLEKELTKDLTDERKWMNVESREKYLYLIKAYKRFGNRVDEQFPLDRQDHLHSLDSLWLWARAQSEAKGVNGLYGIFRQMQREIVDMNMPINPEQLGIFAETILRDPNASIVRALDRIANLIINEKLFIAAFKVPKIVSCDPILGLDYLSLQKMVASRSVLFLRNAIFSE